jgi:hypothetical protein
MSFQIAANTEQLKVCLALIYPEPRVLAGELGKFHFREMRQARRTSARIKRQFKGGLSGHTRDRVRLTGSENPTASIPVIHVGVVPAGPLPGRRRWVRLLLWSRVEVKRVDPPRRGLGRSRRRTLDVVTRLSNLEALHDARAAADAFPPN